MKPVTINEASEDRVWTSDDIEGIIWTGAMALIAVLLVAGGVYNWVACA